jgi:hypothetical protein
VQRTEANGIVLSGSGTDEITKLKSSLEQLSDAVEIPVFLGGDISINCFDQLADSPVLMMGSDLKQGIRLLIKHIKPNS